MNLNRKIDKLVSEYIFNDKVNILPYSSDFKYIHELIKYISRMDNCCLKLNFDIPGNIWDITIRGNDYNCEKKVFLSNKDLLTGLSLAALRLIMTKEELRDKINDITSIID